MLFQFYKCTIKQICVQRTIFMLLTIILLELNHILLNLKIILSKATINISIVNEIICNENFKILLFYNYDKL